MTRVDKEVRRLAKAKAKRENRTLNNYVETLVRQDLGMDAPEEDREIDINFE
jgi:predicted HicB family RNase H-like nuclease